MLPGAGLPLLVLQRASMSQLSSPCDQGEVERLQGELEQLRGTFSDQEAALAKSRTAYDSLTARRVQGHVLHGLQTPQLTAQLASQLPALLQASAF